MINKVEYTPICHLKSHHNDSTFDDQFSINSTALICII